MIRNLRKTDLAAAKAIITSVGLFPADMLDDMVASYLADPVPAEI